MQLINYKTIAPPPRDGNVRCANGRGTFSIAVQYGTGLLSSATFKDYGAMD